MAVQVDAIIGRGAFGTVHYAVLRDEQKDARAGVVMALTLCWTLVILYDLLDSSAEQSLLVWLWFVVLPALASVFAIF